MATINLVIMAKPAIPGCVKTRLIGRLCPNEAAEIHAAMLTCVLSRVRTHISLDAQVNPILAMDNTLSRESSNQCPLKIDSHWRQIDQGSGDLGQRLERVWRRISSDPVVFLGADSPDVPEELLRSIVPALNHADVAIGPVDDGGYWTLAAREFQPKILANIDWGTPSVYYQTCTAASQAGLCAASLESWHDVDRPDDLVALRHRIDCTQEPALVRLRFELDRLCQETNL